MIVAQNHDIFDEENLRIINNMRQTTNPCVLAIPKIAHDCRIANLGREHNLTVNSNGNIDRDTKHLHTYTLHRHTFHTGVEMRNDRDEKCCEALIT